MSEHTPGPWSVWRSMDNTLVIHAMAAPGEPIVADVEPIKLVPFPGQSEYDAPGDTPSDEEIANANLIAAAPDFMAACEGPEVTPWTPDLTRLSWLRALLTDLLGDADSINWERVVDREALLEAMHASSRLLEALEAAYKKAKGEEVPS